MNIETLLKTEYNKHREGGIIVYDNEVFKLTLNNENHFTIFLRGLVDNGGKVQLLSGGFEECFRMYPNHCSQYDHSSDVRDGGDLPINHLTQGVGQLNLNCRTPERINTHNHYCKTQPNHPPVQVIPYVFLGNYYNANDLKCLKRNKIGSKRHSLQAVELSQLFQAAVQIVSNLPAPSNGGPIYRLLSMPAMRTRWMAGAAAHKSG